MDEVGATAVTDARTKFSPATALGCSAGGGVVGSHDGECPATTSVSPFTSEIVTTALETSSGEPSSLGGTWARGAVGLSLEGSRISAASLETFEDAASS